MSHPFTSQRKSLIIYGLVWVLAMAFHAGILRYSFNFSISIAITEAVISNALFALLGLIIWYPTRYIPFHKQNPVYSFSAHAAAGAIVILAWLSITIGTLSAIFGAEEGYRIYLSSTIFWRSLIGVMIYLVLVLIYYLISYSRRLRDRVQAEEKLRTLVKESELNMLKAQINPHFLFNSLNSISSLTMSNPEEAREMIIKLSDLMRYSLQHREDEFVRLEEELVRMKDYLAIEKIRFGDKLHYKLDVADACKKIKLPTMILQPLIENAIKYGVYESLEPVSLDFSCKLENGFMCLELQNDYDPDQTVRKGTGLGLQNVSERIRLAYDGEGRVKWSKVQNKFIVTMIIPLD